MKISLTIEKTTLTQRRNRVRKTFEKNLNNFKIFFDFSFKKKIRNLKKQRFFFALKSTNLNLYIEKILKNIKIEFETHEMFSKTMLNFLNSNVTKLFKFNNLFEKL